MASATIVDALVVRRAAMCRLAVRLGATEAEAEDLVQDIALSLLSRRVWVAPPAHDHYLARAVHRRVQSLRRRAVMVVALNGQAELLPDPRPAPEPPLTIELGPAARQVIEWRVAGLTFAEIGLRMGISRHAARRRFADACNRARAVVVENRQSAPTEAS